MSEVFLDSNVLIGLVFRNKAERLACLQTTSEASRVISSNYVVFEVARGFLRRLIALHNFSFDYQTVADLLAAANSGQRRFTYDMPTWTGAIIDYLAEIESHSGNSIDQVNLDEFRAKLRGWIRRGWRQLNENFKLIDHIGCRDDIPDPFQKMNHRLDQALPVDQCGDPLNCKLQHFIHYHSLEITRIVLDLKALPNSKQDAETKKRITALDSLLEKKIGDRFEADSCYRCGDALICLEAPCGSTVITKNARHFNPIAKTLNKNLIIAKHAQTASIPTERPTPSTLTSRLRVRFLNLWNKLGW